MIIQDILDCYNDILKQTVGGDQIPMFVGRTSVTSKPGFGALRECKVIIDLIIGKKVIEVVKETYRGAISDKKLASFKEDSVFKAFSVFLKKWEDRSIFAQL